MTGEAISWTLELGGSPADPGLLASLKSIEVEDHAELADMLRLRLAIGLTQDADDWTLQGRDAFPRLGAVRVAVTVGSRQAETLIDARIIETRTEIAHEPGHSGVTVVAMDPTVLLSLEEKVRAWPNQPDSGIASQIFSDHGFDSEVHDTQPARQENDRTVIQRGSDMQFLRTLAERNGYELFVEPGDGAPKWHFHPPDLDAQPQGVLSVSMGEATNVNSFAARNDMLRPATVAAAHLDVEAREAQSATAERPSLRALGQQQAAAQDHPRTVLLSDTGLSQSGELATYAQALVDRSSWALRADCEVHTVAYGGIVRAKRPIQVRGVGRELSGTWYVERVQHVIAGGGYAQRIRLRRNAVGVAAGERFQPPSGAQG